jgi:peptide/nickel transport system substrate-binding protein
MEATDDTTVVITLSQPFAAFPETLATEYSMIHSQAVRAEVGDSYGAEAVDGTGPFTLSNFSVGNEVRVARWDDYPGTAIPFVENPGVAYLDEIVWVPILETANRANELISGGIDVVKNPAPQDVPRLVSDPDIVVIEFPALANFFITLNAQKTELGFDDVRVRQAVSHAIDRDGIAAALFFGRAVGTKGPIASNWKWYERGVEDFNGFDPDAAAALLDDAGWTMGDDGVREKDGQKLSFTCLISTAQTNAVLTAEAVSGMLANVGIEMSPRNLEPGDFFGELTDESEAFGFEWLWSAPLDVLVLFKLLPSDAYNGGEMPHLNEAFNDWQSANSDDELIDAASRVQKIWAEEVPMIPIVTTFNIWAHHQRVHGYRPNQAMLYPLYNDVWIES